MSLRTASELLAKAGLEDTAHRRLVLTAVAEAPGPVTAAEAGEMVGVGRTLNRVTLYRILELLAETGLTRRHSGPDRTFRYCRPPFALPAGTHCHAYCAKCGACRCVELPADWTAPSGELAAEGFEVRQVDIRLEGVCPECRKG
ncbi:MAG: Fur family transcriptional regulator [Desulfovibrionaceae bacterium]